MTTQYAVYNPQTGENVFKDTKEEALQYFWTLMIQQSRVFFHDTTYMTVETDETGAETWFNDNNQEIDRPKTAAEITAAIENAKLTAENSTSVVTMP